MSLINYDATISPSDPTVGFTFGLSPTQATGTVNSITPITVSLSPTTGSQVAGFIFGGLVGLAAVNAVGAIIADKANSAIASAISGIEGQSKSFELNGGSPVGFSFNLSQVAGSGLNVVVTVTAATISLSTYSGMLQAVATLNVT